MLNIRNDKISVENSILIQPTMLAIRRAKLGQIQGGCRGLSKIRQRGDCNNFLLFTR